MPIFLTPGAVAGIFRPGDGGDQLCQYAVPDDGSPLRIRTLPPGSYLAVDSAGREASFEVPADAQDVEIPVLPVASSEVEKSEPEAGAVPNRAFAAAGEAVAAAIAALSVPDVAPTLPWWARWRGRRRP